MGLVIGRSNAVLGYVLQHGETGVEVSEIAEALGLKPNYVRAVLVSLRNRGAVRKVGKRWVPTEVGMREVEGLGDIERFKKDSSKLSWVFWLGVAVFVLMVLSSKDKEEEEKRGTHS